MGSPGDSLVRAGLYRGPDRRLGADPPYGRAATVWGGLPRPTPDSIDDLLVYFALGVVIGGRLGNVLFYDPGFYLSHPLEILKVWEGGMAFHGGLIGAAHRHRAVRAPQSGARADVFDLASLVAPIGIFLGRIANFIKPELWGRPTDVPWAMIFPGSDGLPRHPSQLYEAVLEGVALFALLRLAVRAGGLRRPGRVAASSACSMALARIVCEFFREPDPRLEDLGNGLTMGMLLSAPMIAIGLALIAFSLRALARRQHERTRRRDQGDDPRRGPD